MRSVCAVCLVLCALGCGETKSEGAAPSEPTSASEATPTGDVYVCPMRCKLPGKDEPYTQSGPGQCPVCGMDLEKQK